MVLTVAAYASLVVGLATLLSVDTVKPTGNKSNREYGYQNIIQPLITGMHAMFDRCVMFAVLLFLSGAVWHNSIEGL